MPSPSRPIECAAAVMLPDLLGSLSKLTAVELKLQEVPGQVVLAPCRVAAGGDIHHTAHYGNWVAALVRLLGCEDPDGIESVSRANQAGALARISRSIFSRRFSSRDVGPKKAERHPLLEMREDWFLWTRPGSIRSRGALGRRRSSRRRPTCWESTRRDLLPVPRPVEPSPPALFACRQSRLGE